MRGRRLPRHLRTPPAAKCSAPKSYGLSSRKCCIATRQDLQATSASKVRSWIWRRSGLPNPREGHWQPSNLPAARALRPKRRKWFRFPRGRRGAAEPGLTAPSLAPARARLAYGLLKAAMDEAAERFESNGALFAGGWWGLGAHTVESVHAGALATIEFMEALSRAQGAKGVAAAHFAYSRRQRDAIERQILEFLAAART